MARLALVLPPLVCLASLSTSTPTSNPSTTIELRPELALMSQRVFYNVPQLFRVLDLQPATIYDIKVSYPATQPSLFTLQLKQVLLPLSMTSREALNVDGSNDASSNDTRTEVPRRRRLNTAKLRLHPADFSTHKSVRYRLESSDDTIEVEFSLLAKVEGFQRPGSTLPMKECFFDIVVEEMLWGAFPQHTLVLIGWLIIVLFVSGKWVLPYVEKKILLGYEEDRRRQEEMKES